MSHTVMKTASSAFVEKRKPKKGFLTIALVIIFICQFAILCYFNCTQLRKHMGYDSSWNTLRATLIWDEKTLISPEWSETTNLHLDTPMSIASLLYGLTGNALLSFGLADILAVVLLLFMMWKILARMDVGFKARMIALNLVICPYLTTGFTIYNDLGYFSCLLSGASFYSLRTLFMLMIFYEFLKIVQDHKIGVFGWFLCPVCLLSGFSTGIYLIIIMLVPYLAYELEMVAIRNDWKQLIRKESLFAYVCCGFVVAGKVLAMTSVHFVAMDSSRGWTSYENLWKNFGAVIQGFLKLLQALPETVNAVMSVTGFLRLFALAIFVLIVAAFISIFRRTRKEATERDGASLLLLNIILLNLLVFGLFNVQYGATVFEERYLITTFIAAVLIVALFFDGLNNQKALSVMLSLGITVSVLVVDVHSDVNYLRMTNEEWQMDEIQALAEEQNAGVVYFWGDDLAVIGRALRPCDLKRIYKELPDQGGFFIHWGDYTIYDNQEEFVGPTLLVCPRDRNLVPERVLKEYTLLAELDQVKVYGSDRNVKLF